MVVDVVTEVVIDRVDWGSPSVRTKASTPELGVHRRGLRTRRRSHDRDDHVRTRIAALIWALCVWVADGTRTAGLVPRTRRSTS
jgi:hypothetical protein